MTVLKKAKETTFSRNEFLENLGVHHLQLV